jgi:orotate phosphoribosyltransferase
MGKGGEGRQAEGRALTGVQAVAGSLAARIRQCSKLSGRFVLRSGAVSDTYFDKYQFEADPRLLLAIARCMAMLLPPGTQALAGLEMGGIPVVTVLSQATGLPAAFVRKEGKEYGTCRYAEGAALEGKRFVLVEDVVSSGGAIIDALAKLRADGLEPDAALCVIDRLTGGREAVEAAGLAFKALFTLEEIENA